MGTDTLRDAGFGRQESGNAQGPENPDLFWAVRGAAANFGVVTWIKQKLCPIPQEGLIGLLVYNASQAPDVLRKMDEMLLTTSDDLTMYSN